MNREDIIRWAQEAGISIRGHYDETGPTPQELLRFAASVIKSLKPSLQTEFEKMFMEGAAAEREACAKVADDWGTPHADRIAAAIRARGNT